MEFRTIELDNLWVKITGMMLDKLSLKFEVGKCPTTSFNINLLAFVEKLSKKERKQLRLLKMRHLNDSRWS